MVMGMHSSKKEDVLDVRRTVTLAEAIFTVWLCALERPTQDLKKLYPWDPDTLEYTGWSFYNPLILDVLEPPDADPVKEKDEGVESGA